MAITVETRTEIIQLIVGMVDAAPGAIILSELADISEAGLSVKDMAIALADNPAFNALYPTFLTNGELSTKFITNLIGSEASATALAGSIAAFTADLNAGTHRGEAMYKAITALAATAATDTDLGTSAAALANKTAVAIHYSVTTQQSADTIDELKATISTVNSTEASVTAAKASIDGTGSAGVTSTLTTSIDSLSGTGGNDTFIGDNTGTVNTMTAGDAINGGDGTDLFNVFIPAGTTINNLTLPTLTSVESLTINNGTLGSGVAALQNYAASGLTNITIKSPVALVAAANSYFVTLPTIQNLTLIGVKGAAGGASTISASTGNAITVSGVSAGTGGTLVFDTVSSSQTSYTINSIATSSFSTFSNTGGQLATLNIGGTAGLTLTTSLVGLKTIDATANTKGVTITDTAVLNAAFKFTGGAGSDKLTFADNGYAALTAGSQLDGGAGTDTLVIADTALTTGEITRLNAAVNFEVLGSTAALTIDASAVTGFKSFSLDANAAHVINNVSTGTSIAVTVAHAAAITATTAVGVNDLGITIGKSTSSGLAIGTVTPGAVNVALVSTGKSSSTGTNVLTLANTDNSVYTITGGHALTISAVASTATGSKYDASALTKTLTITGNATAFSAGSSIGDIIIGGSAADAITASVNSSSLTGGAGADTFNVAASLAAATAATAAVTTITDFTKGDKIVFAAAAAIKTTAVDLSGAASLVAALDALASDASTDLAWGVYGGNTYLIDDAAQVAGIVAGDTIVKLTGVLDLSTSTVAANTLTFA